jgi:Amt family ammonium transporter
VADGALYGNPGQLGIQATAVAAAGIYSFVASFVLVKIVGLVIALRPSEQDEMTGLDISQHGEEAYLLGD